MKPAFLAVTLVASVVVTSAAPAAQDRAQEYFIVPQPPRIVPFSADFILTSWDLDSGSRHVRVGRVFRDGDNSLRHEMGPSADNVTSISLKHTRDLAAYVWTRGNGVSLYGLTPPPNGSWGPHPRQSSGLTFLEEKFEDFDLVRQDEGNGFTLQAPQLNFFIVYIQLCEEKESVCLEKRFHNIKLGPQRDELFDPSELFRLPIDRAAPARGLSPP
jgi:hypothetical protein